MARYIAIIDSDRRRSTAYAGILHNAGFEVESSSEPRAAITLVARRIPDLIVVAALTSTIDGCRFTRRIRNNPLTKVIPVIFICGSAAERIAGYKCGADVCLTRPVDKDELTAAAASILERVDRNRTAIAELVTTNALPLVGDNLTPAEQRVVNLVLQGKTNREIAAELKLSRRTIENHVSHSLAKMGLRRRTELLRTLLPSE